MQRTRRKSDKKRVRRRKQEFSDPMKKWRDIKKRSKRKGRVKKSKEGVSIRKTNEEKRDMRIGVRKRRKAE